jgi:hypothetical protein
MGSITRSFANNIGSSGILLASAVTNTTVEDVTSFDNAVVSATLVLLSTQTASASANISFTTGLNSTYDEYIFKFINIHPATDNVQLTFNMSTDSGSNYNVTKTTTYFRAYHGEDGSEGVIDYATAHDLAQSTSFQNLGIQIGNDNDQNCSGFLTLFNPSSTTYVKHFISTAQVSNNADLSLVGYIAGYGNTTSAINAVRFQMSSGNIDDGIIKLYGVKKS